MVKKEINLDKIMIWTIILFWIFPAVFSSEENVFLEKKDDISVILVKDGSRDVKRWNIKTTPELKLKMYCKRLIMNAPKNDPCDFDFFEINAGETNFKKCTRTEKLTVSGGNEMTLEISRRKAVDVDVECVVTATDGQRKKYFKDIPSEEVDSHEFGMKPGKKKTTCDCGRALKTGNKRIIFGEDAGENEFPWAVSLQYKSGFHFCGGSIVTRRHVITAAHCTASQTASSIQAVVGVSNLKKSPGRKVYPIREIVNNEFQPRPTRKDIAILITKDLIDFSKTVGPICIPKKDPEMIGKYITAVGWGKMGDNETERDLYQLKKAHMRVVSPFDCNSFWGDQQHDGKMTQICTWSGHRDICSGDSGGPVTWVDPETNRYFLVGLPSLTDCVFYRPTIHTAVHAYYDWITKVVSQMKADGNVCTKNSE